MTGTNLEDYKDKYSLVKMRREDGILEVTFHTDGGSLRWGKPAHNELERAFLDIGRDWDNEVVILTGTGEEYSGPAMKPGSHDMAGGTMTSMEWEHRWGWEGRHLLMNLLNIEAPVIAAVNGPALRHAEIPVMSDIVLAAPEAAFQDTAHFNGGLVPGDGMHIVFPHLLGMNRGRYFLYMGQRIEAQQALELGLVAEIHPRDQLLPRAWEIARHIMKQPKLNRRYTRTLVVAELKRKLHDLLGYGLALEGAAAVQSHD